MNCYDNFYDGLSDTRNLLYRQIDTVAAMNKLLSTLCSEIANLKNYKTNIKGENSFFIKHQLQEIIIKLNNYEISLQELIKIKNGFPIFQLGDIENISSIKTLASMDYKPSTVVANIVREFKILKTLIEESIENSKKESDYQSINVLSSFLYEVNKILSNYAL